jgi:hypothetical protein
MVLLFAVTTVSTAATGVNIVTSTNYKAPKGKHKKVKHKKVKKSVSSHHSWKNVSTSRTCNKKKRR